MNIRAGDRRHPEILPYRCCLSTLAGFERLCRAGPARTAVRIIEACIHVNRSIKRATKFFPDLCLDFQLIKLYSINNSDKSTLNLGRKSAANDSDLFLKAV